MIPKVIHYCWFGGNPLPRNAQLCIKSWQTYLPDYEIKRWDESNFDINITPYTRDAYKSGKYAFVSDYARFWIIYNYGGIYFDTDVEVVKSLGDILSQGAFMGVEHIDLEKITINPGLGFCASAGMTALKDLLNLYKDMSFVDDQVELSMRNIVEITTGYLLKEGLKNTPHIQRCSGFTIYPVDYFCPIDYKTRELRITDNTHTIHHFAESWIPQSTRLKNALGRILGKDFMQFLVKVKCFFKRAKNDK